MCLKCYVSAGFLPKLIKGRLDVSPNVRHFTRKEHASQVHVHFLWDCKTTNDQLHVALLLSKRFSGKFEASVSVWPKHLSNLSKGTLLFRYWPFNHWGGEFNLFPWATGNLYGRKCALIRLKKKRERAKVLAFRFFENLEHDNIMSLCEATQNRTDAHTW